MPAWLQGILDWLLGRTAQASADQQLGKVAQQRDDAVATNKDDERAKEIDQSVDAMSHDELVQKLKKP